MNVLTRYLMAVLATLLLIVLGAFFAYVAFLPAVITILILLGLALMFGLGVYVGLRSEPDHPQTARQIFPAVAGRPSNRC